MVAYDGGSGPPASGAVNDSQRDGKTMNGSLAAAAIKLSGAYCFNTSPKTLIKGD